MTRTRRTDLITAALTVVAGFATLRAGCTHWRVHVEGTVLVDPAYAKHHGAPIRVGLKAPKDGKDTEGRAFTLDTSHPLVAKYHTAGGVTYAKKTVKYSFQFCSGLTSVWYRAELYAWLDLNKNGRLDPGEPRGALKQNPLTREKEVELKDSVKIVIKPKAAPRPRVAPRARATRAMRIAPRLPAERKRPRPRPAMAPRPRP